MTAEASRRPEAWIARRDDGRVPDVRDHPGCS